MLILNFFEYICKELMAQSLGSKSIFFLVWLLPKDEIYEIKNNKSFITH